jgi:hypothetical protein
MGDVVVLFRFLNTYGDRIYDAYCADQFNVLSVDSVQAFLDKHYIDDPDLPVDKLPGIVRNNSVLTLGFIADHHKNNIRSIFHKTGAFMDYVDLAMSKKSLDVDK